MSILCTTNHGSLLTVCLPFCGFDPGSTTISFFVASYASSATYTRLVHPLPALSHINYPFYTPGGEDKRWLGSGQVEEEGLRWVGGLMSV